MAVTIKDWKAAGLEVPAYAANGFDGQLLDSDVLLGPEADMRYAEAVEGQQNGRPAS
jgi:hypothetical protein